MMLRGERATAPFSAEPGSGGGAVLDSRGKFEPRVAVGNILTEFDWWIRAVQGNPNISETRYENINSAINRSLEVRTQDRPDYLVMPELSLPRRWVTRLLSLARRRDLSLIVGLEYRLQEKEAANEALVALRSDGPGYSFPWSILQMKQAPALEEERLLQDVGGLVLLRSDQRPPIYRHGPLFLATYICSELLSISNRAELFGKIDCLFVVEWNQDINHFDALVSSAANDLMCFVVQSNNRKFGDSRIRSPAKNEWERDLLRVRGGVQDHFMVGALDVEQLRRFLSRHRALSGPFKPKPIDLELPASRRRDGKLRGEPS